MENNEQIGLRIKRAREREDLTQKELGDIIDRTESAIRKYEKGIIEVPLSVLEKISLALHTDLAHLMGLDINTKKAIMKLDNVLISTTQTRYELEQLFKAMHNGTISDTQKLKLIDIINSLVIDDDDNKTKDDLLKKFNMLNELGQLKAVESVDLLTKIPEYQKEE